MTFNIFTPSDDFFCDRWCRRYGSLVFIAAAILIAGAYSSDSAFICWYPTHFSEAQSEFSHVTCVNRDEMTAIRDFSDYRYIPRAFRDRVFGKHLSKMRYLPVVLLLQILFFYPPFVFWKLFTRYGGYFRERLVRDVSKIFNNPQPDTNTSNSTQGVDVLAAQFISALEKPFSVWNCSCFLSKGRILIIAYVLTKCGYLLACLVQMVILSAYLWMNFFFLKIDESLWKEVVVNNDDKTMLLFPRDFHCYTKVSRCKTTYFFLPVHEMV